MYPRQYPLFRLFGFQVQIDLSWLLIALLITWTLAAGWFPISYPGLSREMYWWMGITGAAGVFVSGLPGLAAGGGRWAPTVQCGVGAAVV